MNGLGWGIGSGINAGGRNSVNGNFPDMRTPMLCPCLLIPPGLIVAPRRRDRRPVVARESPGRGHQGVDLEVEVRGVAGHKARVPARPDARAHRRVDPVAATAAVLVVPLGPGDPGGTKRKSSSPALDLDDRAPGPAILAGQPAAGPALGIERGRGARPAPRQALAGRPGAKGPLTRRTVPLVLMVRGELAAPHGPPVQVAGPVEVAVRPTGATATDRMLEARRRPGLPVRHDAQAHRPGVEPPPRTLARSRANPSTVPMTTIRCPKGPRSGAT